MAGAELQSAIRGLGIGVGLIALFLGLRQWYEQRGRGDLSVVDRVFHARQAVRRWLGVTVLAALAALLAVGSRIEPRVEGRGNPNFVILWLGILALIAALLAVALWDSAATWRYARDRRLDLVRDHVAGIRRRPRAADAECPGRIASDDPPPSER